MSERYRFDADDDTIIGAAVTLLKKVATAETTTPAQLVSIAKLQHVLSVLPRATSGVDVSVSVACPRRMFGEIETSHWWEVAVGDCRLSICSGGHFHRPSTGGDTFTTMNWTAIPEEPTALEDYREWLWVVPDVRSFPEGVARVEFSSGGYSVEITDNENPLLEEDEEGADEGVGDEVDEALEDEDDAEPIADEETPRDWSITAVDAVEEQLATIVDPDEIDANKPTRAYNAQNCDFCGCTLERRGLYVDGRLRGDLMWGNMCAACFSSRGEGIGRRDGQLYARQPDGDWRMVAGWTKLRKSATLEGPRGKLEINLQDLWNILLTVEDLGWQPEQSRIAYLAPGVVVSEHDAANLARAAGSIFTADPAAVKLRVSIQKLSEFGVFCVAGRFRIIR